MTENINHRDAALSALQDARISDEINGPDSSTSSLNVQIAQVHAVLEVADKLTSLFDIWEKTALIAERMEVQ